MTARFLKIIDWLLPWECVFAKGHDGDYRYVVVEDDKDDPGGRTKFGLDHRSHPDVNLDKLDLDKAKAVYFSDYWQRYSCENYPYPYGEVVFNCCVNAGWGRAQKIIAAGATDAASFLNEQDAFYRRLANARPQSRKFLKGWLNRTADLRKFVGL